MIFNRSNTKTIIRISWRYSQIDYMLSVGWCKKLMQTLTFPSTRSHVLTICCSPSHCFPLFNLHTLNTCSMAADSECLTRHLSVTRSLELFAPCTTTRCDVYCVARMPVPESCHVESITTTVVVPLFAVGRSYSVAVVSVARSRVVVTIISCGHFAHNTLRHWPPTITITLINSHKSKILICAPTRYLFL